MQPTLILVARNLRIYFRDRVGVFLSLLSPLILLLLYVLFLGSLQVDSLQESIPGAAPEDVEWFVSSWVYAGMVMITTFSTGLAALGVYVDDRVSGRFKEFRVSALRRWQLVLGYQIAAVTIATTVSIGVLIIGAGLLQLLYGKAPSPTSLLTAAALTVLLSAAFSALSSFILTFVKTPGAYTAFSTISGTLLGFLAGAYLPLGLLSEQVRDALNVLPFSPSAMLLREPLAGKALDQIARGISEVREGVGAYYGFTISVGDLELTPLIVITALLALNAIFTALGTWRMGRTVV